MGQVDRLSIAVVVDGMYAANPDTGEMVFTPRTEEEMTRIRELVSNAVGFETARGDAIEVSCIAFGELNVERERSLAEVIGDYALRMGKPILNAVLVFLFLLLIVRPVILALIRPKVEAGEVMEGLEGLPMGEERIALIEGEEEIDALDALKKIEDIKAHALQISEQNMEQAVGILKSWLKDTGGHKVGHSA